MTQCPVTEEATEVVSNEFQNVVGDIFKYQSRGEVELLPARIANVESHFPAGTDLLSSLITIDGDEIQCSVVLIGTTEIITSLAPFKISDARDWLGELTNLVAGGLKNNFCEYSVECQLGLPSFVRYTEWVSNDFDWQILSVTTQFGVVFACLQADVDPEAEWEHNAVDAAADDGDICLF